MRLLNCSELSSKDCWNGGSGISSRASRMHSSAIPSPSKSILESLFKPSPSQSAAGSTKTPCAPSVLGAANGVTVSTERFAAGGFCAEDRSSARPEKASPEKQRARFERADNIAFSERLLLQKSGVDRGQSNPNLITGVLERRQRWSPCSTSQHFLMYLLLLYRTGNTRE